MIGKVAETRTLALIWMHGLGDTPSGWISLKHQLNPVFYERLGRETKIEWVFPPAPVDQVTINAGASMTSWFDILDWPIGLTARDDPDGLMKSIRRIDSEIEKLEAAGIPSHRIIVGGFSQGGAVALNTVYRSAKRLAGCVCLSGWLQLKQDFAENVAKGPNAGTPLFWGHGMFDDVVLPEQQEFGIKLIEDGTKIPVTHMLYRMRHSSHPLEIEHLSNFLVDAWTASCNPHNAASAAAVHATATTAPAPMAQESAIPSSAPAFDSPTTELPR